MSDSDGSELPVTTYFAPAGRDEPQEFERKQTLVASIPLLQRTIDAMSDLVVILNEHRQIVAANRALLETLDCKLPSVLGKRLGELMGCQNVPQGPDGCGTAPDCSLCGAVQAVLESQRNDSFVTRECRISLAEPSGAALDLKVSATAVRADGERFTICVAKDISDQKRLAVLARLFFHDVMNTAGSIQGYTELLRDRVPRDSPEDEELAELAQLSEELVEEIRAQRDLTYAESGELEPDFQPVAARDLLQHLQKTYARHPVARTRAIALAEIWPGQIVTDARLLGRVLGNMIKNGLEAIPQGQTVTVRCVERGEDVVFSVHNPGLMPPDVQAQVFQRSFSTKAKSGRGIGAHSMKLLGERYLGGKVEFRSETAAGTTFAITLPKIARRRPAD
ncbi:MAG: PAS domain-containing sensor histidine kinase [Candidatus Anammoximicrobium sp.]|nr:PAS domain-containing sensor histidine kinase [Candidatus Anammoximicrobium sp.]